MKVEIKHDIEKQEFLTEVDGLISVLQYSKTGSNTLDYYRTFVPPELRSRGIAGELTKHALDYAKENGFKIIPSCPFIRTYIEHHTQYAALIA